MDVPAGFTTFDPQGPFLWSTSGRSRCARMPTGSCSGCAPEERRANHRGTIQGGLLSTFADFALGRAMTAGADDDQARATVSLTVDFLRPASPGDWIESRTRVERVGGTLSFADSSLSVEGREIVRARAVFVVAGWRVSASRGV